MNSHTVEITGITHRGEGVGRIDGKAVFVPYTIPGETVEIDIIEDRKKYSRGKVRSIVKSIPYRINPECPHFWDCGGCQFQHVAYEYQLYLKTQMVTDNMRRIGKINTDVQSTIGMPDDPWRYRNKAVFHIGMVRGNVVLGYYKMDTNDIVPIHTCKLITEKMEYILKYLSHYDTTLSNYNEVIIRQSITTGQTMVLLNGSRYVPSAEFVTACPSEIDTLAVTDDYKIEVLFGPDYLEEHINGVTYKIPPQSFFQNNLTQTKMIANIIKDMVSSGNNAVLDVYCGVGTFAMQIAPQVGRVHGIESSQTAIEYAKLNAQLNNISNTSFTAGLSEDLLTDSGNNYDTVVLDPPRTGCHPKVITAIADQQIGQIIYVSCEPSTLARDLAEFTRHGYTVIKIQPVDMFPQTHHVECVVCLNRKHS